CRSSIPRSRSRSSSARTRPTTTYRCCSARSATAPTEGADMALGQNNYGKSDVRVVKVVRGPERHEIRDLTVDVALEGDFAAAHGEGDNTGLLATDTMRNTVYAIAKQDPIEHLETFARRLVAHFVEAGPTVARARVRVVEHP